MKKRRRAKPKARKVSGDLPTLFIRGGDFIDFIDFKKKLIWAFGLSEYAIKSSKDELNQNEYLEEDLRTT